MAAERRVFGSRKRLTDDQKYLIAKLASERRGTTEIAYRVNCSFKSVRRYRDWRARSSEADEPDSEDDFYIEAQDIQNPEKAPASKGVEVIDVDALDSDLDIFLTPPRQLRSMGKTNSAQVKGEPRDAQGVSLTGDGEPSSERHTSPQKEVERRNSHNDLTSHFHRAKRARFADIDTGNESSELSEPPVAPSHYGAPKKRLREDPGRSRRNTESHIGSTSRVSHPQQRSKSGPEPRREPEASLRHRATKENPPRASNATAARDKSPASQREQQLPTKSFTPIPNMAFDNLPPGISPAMVMQMMQSGMLPMMMGQNGTPLFANAAPIGLPRSAPREPQGNPPPPVLPTGPMKKIPKTVLDFLQSLTPPRPELLEKLHRAKITSTKDLVTIAVLDADTKSGSRYLNHLLVQEAGLTPPEYAAVLHGLQVEQRRR